MIDARCTHLTPHAPECVFYFPARTELLTSKIRKRGMGTRVPTLPLNPGSGEPCDREGRDPKNVQKNVARVLQLVDRKQFRQNMLRARTTDEALFHLANASSIIFHDGGGGSVVRQATRDSKYLGMVGGGGDHGLLHRTPTDLGAPHREHLTGFGAGGKGFHRHMGKTTKGRLSHPERGRAKDLVNANPMAASGSTAEAAERAHRKSNVGRQPIASPSVALLQGFNDLILLLPFPAPSQLQCSLASPLPPRPPPPPSSLNTCGLAAMDPNFDRRKLALLAASLKLLLDQLEVIWPAVPVAMESAGDEDDDGQVTGSGRE
ncbi:hypothetical protein BDK51DRAFT_43949 [Blyttiomyces helicus]|uniref:Uncharacterized protein n=1 Tax=Blyttiomyces helicus TaxID=388810 RepID=A0A4P9WM66_9FUNG|nr:hypothetical protein BDK51DRAFT_43949 [Blyttiomyces helicus]|eukprot:RKO92758.1 hypothetical protein BDK51DRAFT_43949 [Blyttiomyces helicus]